jgi:ABC-type nitrate/sulfonate/bicarbonate transport system substrate-binding protein
MIAGRWRSLGAMSLVLALVALIATAQATSKTSREAVGAQTTPVKMAIGPYLDYIPWIIAGELGVDEEFGLDISTVTLQTPQLAGPQLRRGDLDVAYSCQACNFPILKQIPDLRDWLITNQFKGFAVIGRKGKTQTYEQFAKGSSQLAARRSTLRQFIGREFVMVTANFRALLEGAMKEVGLDPAQVKIVDFADDSKAALAYIRGTGDYYIGSLPQETKMLQDYPDRFIKVGGHEILGPGGLWYSTAIALQGWLDENRETALKLLGVWYRTMRYLREQPNTTVPLMTKLINERVAAKFKPETVRFLITNLIAFNTLKEAQATTFNSKSTAYHIRSVNHYAKGNAKVLPADYTARKYFVEDTWFKRFAARKDLVALVNRPLKAT